MEAKVIGWLITTCLLLAVITWCFRSFPLWLLLMLGVVLVGTVIDWSSIVRAITLESGRLEAVLWLFFVMVGLKLILKGFGAQRRQK